MPGLRHQFLDYLGAQEKLCRELEAIADSLPDKINSHDCLETVQRLVTVVKRAHVFEENTLFPELAQRAAGAKDITSVIERLKFEHWGDEDYAEQVFHHMRDFVTGRRPEMTEQLAWMLRGFFENLRRHIAFEKQYLLPLAEGCA
jgi:hemerythrin-like domain-containing protein